MKLKKHKDRLLLPYQKTWQIFAAGICISGFIIFLGIFDYISAAYNSTSRLIDEYLEKITQQEIDIINIKFKNSVRQIAYASQLLHCVADIRNKQTYLQLLKENSDFDYIYVLDTDRNIYNIKNQFVASGSVSEYFFSKLEPGKTSVSTFLKDPATGEQVCYVYAPITDGNTVNGCIYGIFLAETISKLLQFSVFNQQGTINIMTKDGINIASSGMPQKKLFSKSFFTYLEGIHYPQDQITELRIGMADNKKGILHIKTGTGKMKTCAYAPIGINDWYILTAIPENTVGIYAARLQHKSIILAIQLISAFMIIAFLIAYRYHRSKAFLKASLFTAQKSAQILNMAVSQTQISIFEYDVAEDRFSVLHTTQPSIRLLPALHTKSSAALDADNDIPVKQKKQFCEVFHTVRQTGKPVFCDITDGDELSPAAWYRLTLSAITNEKDKPTAIIGTVKDITEIKQTAIRYAQEEQFRNTMLAEYETCWSVNLSRKTILSVISNGKAVFTIPPLTDTPYTKKIIEDACKDISPEEKRTTMQHLIEPDTLITLYRNGTSQIQEKYIFRGNWYASIINLVEDPVTEDLLVFVYTKNIDSQTRKEQRLKFEAERDPLTKLYNRATLEMKIENVLSHIDEQRELCALFILDLDNFKNINDEYGHQTGDDVLIAVADELNAFSRKYDLIGRLGGDEFIGFIRELPSKKSIEQLMERICSRLWSLTFDGIPEHLISASIGIAFAPENGETFVQLYSCADSALYDAKRKGKNQAAVYSFESPPPPVIPLYKM